MEIQDKNLYELAYFITPDLRDEEAIAYAQKIKTLIGDEGGEVNKEEMPRKRRLAYPIRHKAQGYFGYLHFLSESAKIGEIKNKLFLDTNILRHLIITVGKSQLREIQKPAQAISTKERLKKIALEKAQVEKAVFKKEIAPAKEEKKAELEELDKKLEEILNK